LLTTLTPIGITYLTINGFDFRVPYQKFKEEKRSITWFRTGDLFFRVYSEKNDIRVRHLSKMEPDELTKDNKLSLEKAYPDLGLKTLYKSFL
jgi:hypothetical protein